MSSTILLCRKSTFVHCIQLRMCIEPQTHPHHYQQAHTQNYWMLFQLYYKSSLSIKKNIRHVWRLSNYICQFYQCMCLQCLSNTTQKYMNHTFVHCILLHMYSHHWYQHTQNYWMLFQQYCKSSLKRNIYWETSFPSFKRFIIIFTCAHAISWCPIPTRHTLRAHLPTIACCTSTITTCVCTFRVVGSCTNSIARTFWN